MTWVRCVTLGVGSASVLLALPANAERAAARATVVKVENGAPGEFSFKLTPKSVKLGTVIFKVSNHGAFNHDFKDCASNKGGRANSYDGTGTALILGQHSATLKITFKKKGAYEYLCTVFGHAALGMKGVLKVG